MSRAKKVVIYCRESRDDGFENYERIETQREILERYCKKQHLGDVVAVIQDDNKTGTSFERLEPVKEMIRRREADIFLCKDASRLGRNILESLLFTEFLAQNGVELIFESERYDEDLFPLLAWFNERRVKDDSIKIRRVLRHKMESGSMVIKAPYGYIKQGGCLLVNPDAAAVVKEIFHMYTEGQGLKEIACSMNEKHYPTPSKLRAQRENSPVADVWNAQHIRRILSHVAYSGAMPYGMREKKSYKSKKFITKPRKDWIIIPNHHEAIIPAEIFEAAQKKLRINL